MPVVLSFGTGCGGIGEGLHQPQPVRAFTPAGVANGSPLGGGDDVRERAKAGVSMAARRGDVRGNGKTGASTIWRRGWPVPAPPSVPIRGHLPLKGGEGRVWRCPHSRITRCSRRSAATAPSGPPPRRPALRPSPHNSEDGSQLPPHTPHVTPGKHRATRGPFVPRAEATGSRRSHAGPSRPAVSVKGGGEGLRTRHDWQCLPHPPGLPMDPGSSPG
jgi:hypothetical protein